MAFNLYGEYDFFIRDYLGIVCSLRLGEMDYLCNFCAGCEGLLLGGN